MGDVPPPAVVPPGTQLVLTNEQWTVAGPLPGGVGGFGTLHIVQNAKGAEAVAKFVQKDPGADRELLIGVAIQAAGFANVIPVLDHGDHGGEWVLVMPRADTNLADHMQTHAPIGVHEAILILIDVATALDSIVGDLVHRDLKPQNILSLGGKWCLADFGIARYAAATTSPDTRKFALTAPYAAPEQWKLEHATPATDVYAFGVVGYELLAGQWPFPGPDFRHQHLNTQAPALTVGSSGLQDLIEECLFKPPETRPTPAEIVKRLRRAAQPPRAAGLEKLAAANRSEIQRQASAHAQASSVQQSQQRREELHDTAVQMFDRVNKELVDNIQGNAPVAKIEFGPTPDGQQRQTAGKLLVATLNGAQIGLHQPRLSPSKWTQPFTVISEAVITVTRLVPTRGWRGRSHSLWFCDAKVENRFEWYELAFWSTGRSPDIEPFATTAGSAGIAFSPVMGNLALAWPVTRLDRSDLSEFVERWLGHFGDAATGTLQRPGMMPERPGDGSWRRS